ncbi:MAG TPA: 2-aminoethylphosphonate aminotransferase [Myxococcota bacterium]|nr:2-aminoethylphosphonate aminotransferase [Myxococcota bacterium]
MILLNPGPVCLSPGVRRALLAPDLCHREPEFFALQAAVRARLVEVYGLDPSRWAAVLLTGSGTAAVEAMLASLVPAAGRLLVLENGAYGERMSAIARAHAIERVRVDAGWGGALELDSVERALDANPGVSHLGVVHHETTTGRLNRLDALGALCRRRGVQLLVDAVSSFGAEEIDFEGWGLAACAATGGKCLHGVPGLGFVVARRDALAAACRPARSVYLDLALHHAEQDRGGTPFTPGLPAFYALAEALRELAEQGGWRARQARYRSLAQRVARGLERLGIEPLLPAGDSSVVLRSYRLPEGMLYAFLHDELKKRSFVIYAGQGALSADLFRISTMGEIADGDIDRLLDAFAEIVRTGEGDPE